MLHWNCHWNFEPLPICLLSEKRLYLGAQVTCSVSKKRPVLGITSDTELGIQNTNVSLADFLEHIRYQEKPVAINIKPITETLKTQISVF